MGANEKAAATYHPGGHLPAADFDSHHIEGYAVADPDRRHFSVPLVSHIEGNLWTGGCLGGIRLGDDFRHVVSLYRWQEYTLGPDTDRLTFTMYDDDGGVDSAEVHAIADQALELVRDGQTLIHCQAGLNRSGLVAALVLIKMGRSPLDAIELLRAKRSPVVLCNQTFEAWLQRQGGA